MRGHCIFMGAVICLVFHLAAGTVSRADMQGAVWKEAGSGIRDSDLQRVAVSPDNPDTVYASSLNSVYRTSDVGNTWDEVLSIRGTGDTINALAAATDAGTVFAGTREGLYRSDDSGMHWRKIFRGVGEREGAVFSIAVHPRNSEIIYIGTGSGLYWTENNGKDWNRGRNVPAGSMVTSLSIDNSEPHIIYASTEKGLYKSIDRGIEWQRILGTTNPGEDNIVPTEDKEKDADEINAEAEIKAVAIDPHDNRKIYLGTSSGLLVSEDSGATWKTAGPAGLLIRDIRHLVISSKDEDSIIAATGKGVFRYSAASGDWEELYNGLVSRDVRFLALSEDLQKDFETLWSATRKGIFKTVPQGQPYSGRKDIDAREVLSKFDHEPTIEEVRLAAIEYAEVQPEKIEKWRKAAARKALLPDLRLEYQKNRNWQKGTYFYSNASEKYTDDDITVDRDRGWSISLNWNLGELIWNNDQTSIDSRSKLMVELRDDVLNEVTRLYFERRKVQIETLFMTHEDIRERLDRELRLQELTADIDALTGSYLTKRLAQAK